MVEGRQGVRPNPRQQFPKAGITIEVSAQGQGVDEETDEAFQARMGTACHRRAHHHIIQTGQTAEQGAEGSEDHHEERRPLGECQAAQRAEGCGVEAAREPGASGIIGAFCVGGPEQQDRRRTPEPVPPPGKLPREHLTGHEVRVPQGVVAVLQRERGQDQCRIVVERGQFPIEDPQRPAVRDQVMDDEHQGAGTSLLLAETQAHQRARAQVERRLEQLRQLRRGVPADRHRCRGRDALGRHAVHLDEGGAQTRMTGNDPVPGALQCRQIGRTAHPHDPVQVPRAGVRLQALQEPESLLHRRQWQEVTGGAPASVRRRQRRRGPAEPVDSRSNAGHGWGLEQHPQRQADLEGVPDPGDEPRGQQRMSAQRKEVVQPSDLPGLRRQLQRRAEQLADDFLAGRERRTVRRRGHQGTARCKAQGCPVHLAIGRQRQCGQPDEQGRHERFGQLPAERGTKACHHRPLVLRTAAGRFLQHDPGHQLGLRVPGRREAHDGRRNGRQRGQAAFDLAGFDAPAAELELVVGPPEQHQLPGAIPAGAVTAAVVALMPRTTKALGGECRLMQVALADAGTRDAEFAGHATGHRLAVRVEEHDPAVGEGPADRHRSIARQLAGGSLEPGAVDRGFSHAVGVDQARTRCTTGPEHAVLRCIPLVRADDQQAQCRQASTGTRHLAEQQAHDGGDKLGHLDAGPVEQVEECRRIQQYLPRTELEATARPQGADPVTRKDIEGCTRHLQVGFPGCEIPGRLPPGQRAGEVAVGDDHALGPAGRAGGIEHVGRLIRACRLSGRDGGFGADGCGISGHIHERNVHGTGQLPRPGFDDQAHEPCIRCHPREAQRRIIRVQRHIRCAGLQHAQHGNDVLRTTPQADADPLSVPDTHSPQVARELI